MANALEQISELIRAAQLDQAQQLCASVLQQAPDQPHTLYFLGMIATRRGQLDVALDYYDRAIAQLPSVAEFHLNRGFTLFQAHRLDDAQQAFDHCLTLRPDDPLPMANLATIATTRGQHQLAADWLRKALALQPASWELKFNLANALGRLRHAEEAVQLYQDVLQTRPDFHPARNNLGNTLRSQGRLTEANDCFETITRDADARTPAWHNLIYGRQYAPDCTPAETFDLATQWARRDAADRQPLPAAAIDRSPDRRLRVGFSGTSFHQHPHGFFLWPILEHLNRGQFELHVFNDGQPRTAPGDPVRQILQNLTDHWHDTASLDAERFTRYVRSHHIDLLINTTGHTESPRLTVLMLRPAPVQINWLGGPQVTTGLTAVDYVLTDANHVPAAFHRYYTERIHHLPEDYICYRPPDDAPQPADRPPSIAHQQPVTFGYFGQLAKISQPVIDAWARIMTQVPDARLMLKYGPLSDPATAHHWQQTLADAGIQPHRLILEGFAPHAEFLASYDRVDIALDTFPYAGGITTLEALWMGVPSVSVGWPANPVASHSVSHLRYANCPELLAADVDAYVALAVELAGDPAQLTRYRQTLRPRLAASPVCDGPRYARHFESALRTMWRNVCQR